MEEVTAVITQESAKISCNFEQVENALHDRLSEYEGAVFTEDSKTKETCCKPEGAEEDLPGQSSGREEEVYAALGRV